MSADELSPTIGERVRAAERRRASSVTRCVLAGACLFVAGLVTYALAPHAASARAPLAVLLLLGAGLTVAFPVAALLALLLGPTWRQRQQDYQSRCHVAHENGPLCARSPKSPSR